MGPYDENIIEPVEPYFRKALSGIIFLSALLCVLCYKWRGIANVFMMLEGLIRLCVVFIPNSVTFNTNPLNTAFLGTTYIILFLVHESSSIIFMTLVLAVQIFVGDHIIYMRGFSVGQTVFDIGLMVTYFSCISVFAIVLNYTKDLQNRLRISNDAQTSMLNAMHEGVLIVDQDC